jgi:hypothetical protein
MDAGEGGREEVLVKRKGKERKTMHKEKGICEAGWGWTPRERTDGEMRCNEEGGKTRAIRMSSVRGVRRRRGCGEEGRWGVYLDWR